MTKKTILASLVLLFILASCNNEIKDKVEDSVSNYSQEELKYARGFQIHRSEDIVKIVVLNLENEGRVLQTLFFHKNKFEKGANDKRHFMLPLGDISVSSTTHASYLLSLGLEKYIKGIAWASYLQNEKLIAQVESGNTMDITGSSEVDLEKLLATNSNAYTNYPFGMDDKGKLGSIDLPVIIISEYLEESPLARAEWIKFFGALYDKTDEANFIFSEIEKEYSDIKREVMISSHRPTVLIGSEQNGVWHMPGADSFISQMISDAGGSYLFKDFPGKNNQQVDLEILVQRSHEVNLWGKISNEEITKKKLETEIKAIQSIDAVSKGNVFYCNAMTSDYFGDAVMEPHIILKDLVNIFHPNFHKGYNPKYFQMVE